MNYIIIKLLTHPSIHPSTKYIHKFGCVSVCVVAFHHHMTLPTTNQHRVLGVAGSHKISRISPVHRSLHFVSGSRGVQLFNRRRRHRRVPKNQTIKSNKEKHFILKSPNLNYFNKKSTWGKSCTFKPDNAETRSELRWENCSQFSYTKKKEFFSLILGGAKSVAWIFVSHASVSDFLNGLFFYMWPKWRKYFLEICMWNLY